jgi:hypothetical protein
MAFRDIRKSRKWLSAEEIRFLLLILVVLVGLFIANLTLSRTLPGGEWVFMRWSGARAFLIEKIEPYSSEIARRTQEVAYGRIAFSSEYPYVLNDPFFIVLLYTPLALLRDFTLVRAIWILLSEIALVGSVLLALNLAEWQPPRWFYVLLLGFGVFSQFSLTGLASGTPSILLAFLYLCILLALRSFSDELAGALLALVAYQWEVGGLFFLFVLFFVFTNRRWGALGGFGMAMFVLLVVSFMTNSGWGLPYIRAVLADWFRGETLTFGHILSTWFPNARFPLGNIVAIVLGFIVFAEWVASVHEHFRRIVWTAALSLAVTPLMGFAIFPSNHVVLILPFIMILALVWERWQRRRVFFAILVFLLVLVIPYALYLQAVYVYDQLILDLISVLPPIAAILGLYWMRWWVLRSPRTWFDRLGDYR